MITTCYDYHTQVNRERMTGYFKKHNIEMIFCAHDKDKPGATNLVR